jgi:hypothetical protein
VTTRAAAATFSIVTRDEAWVIDGSRVRVLQRRRSHGTCELDGDILRASDALPSDALLEACDAAFERDAERLAGWSRGVEGLSVRIGVSIRRIDAAQRAETIIECALAGLSLITTPDAAEGDIAFLAHSSTLSRSGAPELSLPLFWTRGSSAVLLHEAVGHASELGVETLEWPAWLQVTDAPAFDVDDRGVATAPANLLHGDAPRSWRRESFRDVPLERMSRVTVSQKAAPIVEPGERIEILLVAGGSFDPLTGLVSVQVTLARHRHADGAVTWLQPFVLQRSRREIAASLRGAAGEPVRYPGVMCSREGHDVYVESFGCDLLTVFA